MLLRHLRRTVAASIATAFVAASAVAVSVVSPTPASAATNAVTIAVPAYFTDDALWNKVIATPEVTYVIGHPLAPVAGQTYKADPDLQARLAKAKAAGKTTLVYVTGGYDKVDWQVVADRIDTVLGAYPAADGVFIDEINYNQCEKYSSLTKGTGSAKGVRQRQANKLIVLNPGAPMLNCYEGLADGYVNLERAERDIPAWTENVNMAGNVPFYSWMFTAANRPKMWEVIHSVASNNASGAVDAALARNASVIYLTDDVVRDIAKDNPYDNLPTDAFFKALTDRVAEYNAGKSALPAVKALVAPPTAAGVTTTTKGTSSAAAVTTTKKPVTKKVVKKAPKKK